MKRRTLQIRLSESEYEKIKKEFEYINLSALIRDYLLNLIMNKSEDEISKEKLINILEDYEVIDFIYKKLKEHNNGKES